ncbi:hypothetical protein DIPPA_02277 [Diplonema papillatum]|nr:hypothetical protein DIPPA_02277 [Diplonema papillatum]
MKHLQYAAVALVAAVCAADGRQPQYAFAHRVNTAAGVATAVAAGANIECDLMWDSGRGFWAVQHDSVEKQTGPKSVALVAAVCAADGRQPQYAFAHRVNTAAGVATAVAAGANIECDLMWDSGRGFWAVQHDSVEKQTGPKCRKGAGRYS